MPQYDDLHYDPPAPVAVVKLQSLIGDRSIADVHLLIDTGADVSLIPKDAVLRLGAPLQGLRYELVGFDGTRSFADAAELAVHTCGKSFRGRYLLTETTTGILGRDVLALLRLLFDGPAAEWSALRQ